MRVQASTRDAIVFMIGGGNYLERERLTQWAAQCAPRKRVVYGATELLSGAQFCEQLAVLGQKSGT
jgi:sec1 family domain-containing protein 1